MKRVLSLLRNGRGLRLAPVVCANASEFAIRVVLRGLHDEPVDVSGDHCPVSLRPLVLGVRLGSDDTVPPDTARRMYLEMRRQDEAVPMARLALNQTGAIPLKQGALHLFEAECTENRCVPQPALWLRYLLAWQHARTSARRGDALRMSASDLRALDAYYIAARPVYLVGVAHENRVNLFPMDLVGPLSSGEYLLALRATSPAVELMEASRRIAMSSAPAEKLDAVYALGAQHRRPTLDLSTLTLPMSRSPLFGLPVLDRMGLVREHSIEEVHRIGSHVLFITRIEHEGGLPGRQLAHMSGMYVEWLQRRQHACALLAPL